MSNSADVKAVSAMMRSMPGMASLPKVTPRSIISHLRDFAGPNP